MAITYKGGSNGSGSSSPIVVSSLGGPTGVAGGDLIVVSMAGGVDDSFAVTDSIGNTYTPCVSDATGIETLYAFSMGDDAAWSLSVDATFVSSSYVEVCVNIFSGVPLTWVVEQVVDNTGTSVTGDTGSITTAGSLAVATAHSAYSVTSPSWSPGVAIGSGVGSMYLIDGGTSIDGTWSNTYSYPWSVQTVTFAPPSGGGSGVVLRECMLFGIGS